MSVKSSVHSSSSFATSTAGGLQEMESSYLSDYRGFLMRFLSFTNQVNTVKQKRIFNFGDILFYSVNFLQIYILTLEPIYGFGTTATDVFRYLSYGNLNFFDQTSYSGLFITFCVLILFMSIFTLIVFTKDSNSNTVLFIIFHMLNICRYVLYIPISNQLLLFFRTSYFDGEFRFLHDNEIISTDFPTAFYLIFGSITFIGLFVLSCFTSCFIFSRLKNHYFSRSPNSRFSALFFLFQTILLLLTILFSYTPTHLERLKLIVPIITFFLGLFLQIVMLRYIVFYNRCFQFCFVIFLCFVLGNCTTTFFAVLFPGYDYINYPLLLTPQLIFCAFFVTLQILRTCVCLLCIRIAVRNRSRKYRLSINEQTDEYGRKTGNFPTFNEKKRPWYLRTSYDVDILIHTIGKEKEVVNAYNCLSKSFRKTTWFPLYHLFTLLEQRKYKKKKKKKNAMMMSLIPTQNFKVNQITKEIQKRYSAGSSLLSLITHPPDELVMVYVGIRSKNNIDYSGSGSKQNNENIKRVERVLERLFGMYHLLFNNIFHMESGYSSTSFSRLISEIEVKEGYVDHLFQDIMKRTKENPVILRKYANFLKVVKGNLSLADHYFQMANELEESLMDEKRRENIMRSGNLMSESTPSSNDSEKGASSDGKKNKRSFHRFKSWMSKIVPFSTPRTMDSGVDESDEGSTHPASLSSDSETTERLRNVQHDPEELEVENYERRFSNMEKLETKKMRKPRKKKKKIRKTDVIEILERRSDEERLSEEEDTASSTSHSSSEESSDVQIRVEAPTPCSVSLRGVNRTNFNIVHPESIADDGEENDDEEEEGGGEEKQSTNSLENVKNEIIVEEKERDDVNTPPPGSIDHILSPPGSLESTPRREEEVKIHELSPKYDATQVNSARLGVGYDFNMNPSTNISGVATAITGAPTHLGTLVDTVFEGVSKRKRNIYRKIDRKITCVLCLKIFLIIFLFVSFGIIVFVFVMALQVVNRFTVASTFINAGALNRKLTVSVAFHVKLLQINGQLSESRQNELFGGLNVSDWLKLTDKTCGALERGLGIVYSRPENTNYFSESENSVSLSIFSAPESTYPYIKVPEKEDTEDYNEELYSEYKVTRIVSLIDGMNKYIKECRILSSLNETEVPKISGHVSFLFIMSNMETLLEAEIKLLKVLIGIEDGFVQDFLIVMIVVPLGSSMSLFLIFFSCYCCLCYQRNRTYEAFKLMPKDSILALVRKFSGPSAEGNDGMEEKKKIALNTFSFTEKLLFKFLCVFGFLLLLVTVIMVGGIVSSLNFSNRNFRVEYSGRTRMLTHRTHFYTTELLFGKKGVTENIRFHPISYCETKIKETTDQISDIIDAIRFGDSQIPSSSNFPEVSKKWNEDPCDFTNKNLNKLDSLNCLSLSKKYNVLIDSAFSVINLIKNMNPSNSTINSTSSFLTSASSDYYQKIFLLDYADKSGAGVLQKTIQSMVTIFEQSNESNLEFLTTALYVSLALGIPLFFLVYLVTLCGVMNPIQRGIMKIKLLFMLFPLEIIMKKDIYTYLTVGNKSTKRGGDGLGKLLKKQIKRKKKTIMDLLKNTESMIFFLNSKLNILELSESAFINLGYSQETDLIGRPFKSIFQEPQKIQNWIVGTTKTQSDLMADAKTVGSDMEDNLLPCKLEIVRSEVKGIHYLVIMRNIMTEKRHLDLLEKEKEYSDQLLLNIFPKEIARKMVDNRRAGKNVQEGVSMVSSHKSVSILFSDLVGFTKFSTEVSPEVLVHILNGLFSSFDDLCEPFKMEKIKTIGDCYFAINGKNSNLDHAILTFLFAIEMLKVMFEFNLEKDLNFHLRIGISTGKIVAGVIGKIKYCYDCWGDSINVGSRMESTGVPDAIHMDRVTYAHIIGKNKERERMYPMKERNVFVKGKGNMKTYLYSPKINRQTIIQDPSVRSRNISAKISPGGLQGFIPPPTCHDVMSSDMSDEEEKDMTELLSLDNNTKHSEEDLLSSSDVLLRSRTNSVDLKVSSKEQDEEKEEEESGEENGTKYREEIKKLDHGLKIEKQ